MERSGCSRSPKCAREVLSLPIYPELSGEDTARLIEAVKESLKEWAMTKSFVPFEGVQFKTLTTHVDERGFFRELIRTTDEFFDEGFAQWNHTMMYDGVIKAWHLHHKQTAWWYVASGVLRVGLVDLRPVSPTFNATMDFLLGNGQPTRIVRIPRGVARGCKSLHGPAHLLYIASTVYDPDDEIQIPYDDTTIKFDWLNDPPIKPERQQKHRTSQAIPKVRLSRPL
jgi:dTDP-4-dehydrorhamnose 3,5-epimerase